MCSMCVVNIILLEVGCHSQINKVNGITLCITHDKKKKYSCTRQALAGHTSKASVIFIPRLGFLLIDFRWRT